MVHPTLIRAFEEPTQGWLMRHGRIVPGIAKSSDQIPEFHAYWAALSLQALSANEPVIVALGDSLAQGVGASEPEAGYLGAIRRSLADGDALPPVLNLSRSGARVNDVINTQLPALQAANVQPMAVVCTVGNNDLFRATRVDRTCNELTELIGLLPAGAVLATLIGHRSLAARMVNRHIRDEAEGTKVEVADVDVLLTTWRGNFASDGFHPNDTGHQLWADAFQPHLSNGLHN